uniref:DHC_N1 domain-containing protein n=1 Tax=Ascaris lumbricoides TaxID=6252 RepID=A0A0M3IQN8_ASCLU
MFSLERIPQEMCREIIESIDERSDSIALQTTGKLMTIEKKYGTLNVNYSDRLVKLLREVRQLGSLGFIIPSKIINCANVAEKFYKYAIVLKQVAHFYNTIEQQMLPCQQAMMLDEALTFEKLIIAGKKGDAAIATVTWDNPKKLQEFIEKLQEAAQRLTIRNRKLRKAHSEVCEKVIELMNLDLLKEVNKWKDIMLEIRAKFAEQERYAGSKSNMRPWLVHWDRQLYKVKIFPKKTF